MDSNGWKEVQLGDAVDEITVGHVGSMADEYVPIGVPFLRSKNVLPYRITFDDIRYVSEDFHVRLKKSALRPGDVIIVRTGKPGIAAVIPEDLPKSNCSDVVIVRCGPSVNPQFLAYYFNVAATAHVAAHLVGAVQQHFNVESARQLRLYLPKREEQDRIVDIAGALDSKIELNRRMNETLEGIARAIFKSWFVDFDPVRAKAAGRDAICVDDTIAAQFADRLEESVIGPIPSGWRVVSVADLAEYVNGRNFTKDATGTGRMVVRIAELNSGPGGSTVYNDVDADSRNIAYPDDLLFAWSGSLDVYRWHRDDALINQHIFKVVCTKYPKWFVYFQLRLAMSFFQGIASHKATTMGHIKRGHLEEVRVAEPPGSLMALAGQRIEPVFDLIHRLAVESQLLANMRDALLPKLLSGELRSVPDAEKIVGEVA